MKKLRISDTGKKKQHEIDNLSKKKIRETPEGKQLMINSFGFVIAVINS